MLEGPQTWHGDLIPQRVDALGLGDLWTVKFAGSADALWAELVAAEKEGRGTIIFNWTCLLYTSPSPRDAHESRMPSSA